MAKLTLSTITSGYSSVAALNANFAAIATAFENTLSRDGTTPNSMSANIDMNSYRILNLGAPGNDYDPVRLIDLSDSDATGAASATLRSDLAASSGSSLVGFLASGAGASAQTVQAKARQIVSITDYKNDDGTAVAALGAARDNATGILAAINAVPNGSFLYVPPVSGTYYGFSSVSTTKTVALIGGGFVAKSNEGFAHADWADTSKWSGSILKSTATTGDALSFGATASGIQNHQHRDIMILGPGSGTSTGLHILRSVGSCIINVLVANFSVGWNIDNCQDATYIRPSARGCKTGFTLGGTITSNESTFIGLECQGYDTYGLDIVAASVCRLYGGLFQNGKGGYAVHFGPNANLNLLDRVYFEIFATAGSVGAIHFEGSLNEAHRCNFSGDNGCSIVVGAGIDRTKLRDLYIAAGTGPGAAPNLTITAGATNTLVEDSEVSSNGTYTDNGTNTLRITRTGGIVAQKTGNRSLLGHDIIGGTAQGEAGTSTRIMKNKTGIADTTYNQFFNIVVPNSAQACMVRLTTVATLGAGGAVGEGESGHTLSQDIMIRRTPGATTTIGTSATYGGVQSTGAGADTCTIVYETPPTITGAASDPQTVTIRAYVARGAGASTNHKAVMRAELINIEGTGCTIAAA